MGPPWSLVKKLKEASGAATFVETGTFLGDTTAVAASMFGRVITIEASPKHFDAAAKRFRTSSNVTCLLGNSRDMLSEAISQAEKPIIFWLDAHWSGSDTYGSDDECPILDEIAVCVSSAPESIVLIDDARLFLAPPPLPHKPENWPGIRELISALSGLYSVVLDDVIMSVPDETAEVLVELAQQQTTGRWAQETTGSLPSRLIRRFRTKFG